MNDLLDRNTFREAVLKRDNHQCVFCHAPAIDAHHIMERRLFSDGGYYLDNGASVCEKHHKECEMTWISVEQVREACKITKKVLPPHLYPDQIYDKWGNPILPNGLRLRGELFEDESVQKILTYGGAIEKIITHTVKYPRTYHLPWSEDVGKDDRLMDSIETMDNGFDFVATEKMDGENTTMYESHIHARSLDSSNHPSRNWVKNFWSQIRHDIPEGWRVCGENLFAKHSIHYKDLPTYFMGFSIWDESNMCLAWDETMAWFKLLGITPVPVLYIGKIDSEGIQDIKDEWEKIKHRSEGYVIRPYNRFEYKDFRHFVGKFVRKGHVQSSEHWLRKPVEKNLLKV